jgi:hypothetical protein
MALITLTYTNEAELRSAWAGIPSDVVASGNSYLLQQTKLEILLAAPLSLSGKTTGPSNTITLAAAPGAAFYESSTVSTTPYVYSATTGAALRLQGENYPAMLTIDVPYFTLRGLQVFQGAGDTQKCVVSTLNASNLTIDRCILDSAGQLAGCYVLEVKGDFANVYSTLIVHRSSRIYSTYIDRKTSSFENVTFIRPSNFTSGLTGVNVVSDGNRFVNCAALGFDEFSNTPNATNSNGSNNASSGSISFGTNNKPNLVSANQVVSMLNDFRLKTGSDLINAGATPSSYNTLAPNGVRQQGTAADIGAWEFPDTLVAPSATVTAVSVTGQNVTISGTTTGVPTSGTASVSPASVAYNSAVAAGPVAITFGSGTFSVTFTGLKVGKYNLQYQVANSGYTVNGQNPTGSFDIIGATATVTQDAMNGQVLRISGSVSGSPTSGQLIVPAAATNPSGAFDQAKAITITGSTYEVSITLPPGNYDPGILRLTNAAGTSLPQSGTSSVSVIGIDGNPEAPEDTPTPADTVAPTMVGSITVSAQTTSGFTLTWQAATDAVDVAYYEVDNGSGSYVNVGNVLTLVVTGKSSGTTYPTRVRALDAAGNASAPLTASAVTVAAADTTAPLMTGVITVSAVTSSGFTLSVDAATDAVGVTGYEYSIDGGTTYTTIPNAARTVIVTGRSASTSYAVRLRAFDAASNRATPLSATATTTADESATAPPTFTRSTSRTIIVGEVPGSFSQDGGFWNLTNPKKPTGSIDPNSTIDITFDWTKVLADIDAGIDDIVFDIVGLTAGGAYGTGAFATIFVSNVTGPASITCRITTDSVPPRIEDRTVFLTVEQH